MQPWRQEIHELIRSVENVMSLEAFGAHLSAEERGVILLCAEDLAKKFSTPGTTKPAGLWQTSDRSASLPITDSE